MNEGGSVDGALKGLNMSAFDYLELVRVAMSQWI